MEEKISKPITVYDIVDAVRLFFDSDRGKAEADNLCRVYLDWSKQSIYWKQTEKVVLKTDETPGEYHAEDNPDK